MNLECISPPLPNNIGNPINIEAPAGKQQPQQPMNNQANGFNNQPQQQYQQQQQPAQSYNQPRQTPPQQQQQQNNYNRPQSNNYNSPQQQQQQQRNYNNNSQMNRDTPQQAVLNGDTVNLTPIKLMSPYNHRWTIKARVTAKSEMKEWQNERGSGKLFSIDLLDSSVTILSYYYSYLLVYLRKYFSHHYLLWY